MVRAVFAPDVGFTGWVMAPFVGASVLEGVRPHMGARYHISVFEGPVATPDQMMFINMPEVAPQASLFPIILWMCTGACGRSGL